MDKTTKKAKLDAILGPSISLKDLPKSDGLAELSYELYKFMRYDYKELQTTEFKRLANGRRLIVYLVESDRKEEVKQVIEQFLQSNYPNHKDMIELVWLEKPIEIKWIL